MGTSPVEPDRRAVHEEMEQARQMFHCLLDNATVADPRRPSSGTKWTNEQLLFHMLFGYLIVRALLVLARIFSRLPDPPAWHSRGSSTPSEPRSTWSTAGDRASAPGSFPPRARGPSSTG
jgi:hypothetical protein